MRFFSLTIGLNYLRKKRVDNSDTESKGYRMKQSILLVGEQQKGHEEIAATLRNAGFTVLEASDSTEALLQVKRRGVAVLITDLVLPGKNGIELIREVHLSQPDMEAIAMSRYGSEATKDKLSRIGAFGYLEKPVHASILLDMVRAAIKSRRKARIGFGEAEPRLGFNHERILIVDDDPTIQEALSEFLLQKGYRVTLAGNGLLAYEKILVNDYDCIILDVNMPEMDGAQTVAAIRRTDPYTYILLVSGDPDSEKTKEAMALKASTFMPKPLQFEKLLACIKEVDFVKIAESKRMLFQEEKANVLRSVSWLGRAFNPYRAKRIKRTIPYAAAVVVIGIALWVISALFQVRMFKMLEDSDLFHHFDKMIESVQ
jgi:DNA-binding NtrC family response regulator